MPRYRLASLLLCLAALAGPAATAAQTPADEAWDAGDMDRARALYAERLAEDSTDTRALHRLALLHGWGQEYDRSIALFDRLLALAPSDVGARIARARVYAWRGDLDEATAQLEAVLEAHPRHRPALEALATFRSWAGQYDRALELFDEIAALDRSDPSVHYQRARVLGWASRFDEARAVYDSLLVEDPDDVQALLGLGQILAWSDRLDSAQAVYATVIEVDPDNMDALSGLARTSGYAGDLVGAEARWREIGEADPGNAEALVGLGRTLQWQSREAAARPYVERALALNPENGDARELLRWIRAALGPRVAPAFAYEWDSDGNSIITASGHGAWHPVPRVELRVDAYRRSASLGTAVPDPRGTTGGTLTGQLQLPPGWRLAASVGGGVPDSAGIAGSATYSVVVASPARNQVRGALTIGRQLFDATAVLMANRVVYDQVQLNLGTLLGRWTLQGAASAAWFRSLERGGGNRRLALNAAGSRPVTPWLDLGGSLRVFGFDRDLTGPESLGYFDPDRFALLEAPASLNADRGRLDASLALVPGLQQVTAAGTIKAAFRTAGTLSWRQGPGRTASLRLLYALNGASPFAEQATEYRYFAVNLEGRWVF